MMTTGDLPDLEPHRDPQTEQLLDRRRTKWEIQWIRLDDIDWRTTAAQQVRSDGVDEDRLQRYREALDAGATFPAVLAWDRASSGGWVLLGGIHRAQAYEAAGREWIPAYTITSGCDAYVLALEHNATHGDDLSVADKVRHAETLTQLHGISRVEAVRIVGISVSAFDIARAAAAGRARANTFGIKRAWDGLAERSQARIQQGCKDDDVFIEAVRTASGCRLTVNQVLEMCRLVTAAGGAGPDALQAVEDFEAEHHPAGTSGNGVGKSLPPARARRAAFDALDVNVDDVVARCLPVDRKATADLLFRAAKHLAAVAAALQAKDKELIG